MTTFLWLLVVIGGPALIAIVLTYGMIRSRRLTHAEETAREDAIKRLYDKKDTDPERVEVEPLNR